MKTPFTVEYILAIVLLTMTSAVLSLLRPGAGLDVAAVVLGVYAVHLIGLNVELKARISGKELARQAKAQHLALIDSRRAELDHERRDLEARSVELRQKVEAAEREWQQLRHLIRDRVHGSEASSESHTH